MILFTLLSFFSFFTQSTNIANDPLVSATNPFYLSCTYWDGKTFTDPASRSARTRILESANGSRAYGEVQVTAKDGDCENTTTLFVALGKDTEFKAVYTKDGGGNGIRLIGWSPDGNKLLVEINQWAYFTDTGFENVPVVYDAKKNSAAKYADLDKAVLKYFASECEFEHSVRRWKSDTELVVRISKTEPSDEYEQHFCVTTPTLLIFDLEKQVASRMPRTPTKK